MFIVLLCSPSSLVASTPLQQQSPPHKILSILLQTTSARTPIQSHHVSYCIETSNDCQVCSYASHPFECRILPQYRGTLHIFWDIAPHVRHTQTHISLLLAITVVVFSCITYRYTSVPPRPPTPIHCKNLSWCTATLSHGLPIR